jgi:Uma2 family endonuclease
MRAETTPELMTADELLVLDLPGKSAELVRGRLCVSEPPNYYHGKIAARLVFQLGQHVYRRDLGALFGQDTGFKIATNPDTVRAADVAFVTRAREEARTYGYAALAPDLVGEIVSPGDRPGELLSKVGDWLDAGVRIVWVIDPERREARVFRVDGSLTTIDASGALDGEDVLPGFSCLLSDVLD